MSSTARAIAIVGMWAAIAAIVIGTAIVLHDAKVVGIIAVVLAILGGALTAQMSSVTTLRYESDVTGERRYE